MTPQRRIRTLLFRLHQQHHRCFYCGGDLTKPDIEISIDHVYPRSRVPDKDRAEIDTPENCVASCVPCNQKKGDKLPGQDTLARLAELNKDYSGLAADSHYDTILKTSAHLNRLVGLCGIRN